MLIDNVTLYEKQHFIDVKIPEQSSFYNFDYDERSYMINMDFQHFHPFFEMLILLAPEADHLIEGKSFHIKTHDLVLLAPSVLHKSIYQKGDPSKRIIITFMLPQNTQGFSDVYKEIVEPFYSKDPVYRFSQTHKELLFNKLNEIFTFSRSDNYTQSDMNRFVIHTKFLDFMYLLYSLREHNIYENVLSNNHITQKIYDISSYINTNYSEDISLDSLAKQFFVSPCYLSHSFKEITHFNITTYIQMTRIKNAEYKLITTNQKISDISTECGFTSFSQFNRVFRKLTSMSPSEFRKKGFYKH